MVGAILKLRKSPEILGEESKKAPIFPHVVFILSVGGLREPAEIVVI
jgi:hypothetical protein